MATNSSTQQRTESHDPWQCLLRGHAAVRRSIASQLQTAHDLTVMEYEALVHLSKAEGKSMRRVDLAESLQLTASGVTRLLEGLQKRELVDKAVCSWDGRVSYAVLTPTGQKKVEKASGAHLAAVRELFEERYTRAELATLADLLARLPGATGGPTV